MKTLITLVILLIYTSSVAQTQTEDQIENQTEKQIENQTEKEEKETKLLRKMATEKAIELQKELNLTIYKSRLIEKTIFEYSVKANKVLQSNVSAREKSRSLGNIVYFQNEELKEILTVHQFYQYLTLQNVNVAGF